MLTYLSAFDSVDASIALTFWCISLVLGFGWAANKVSEGTIFPSFTLQLLVSIILHDAMSPLTSQVTMIVVICTTLAAIILKSGGDELESRLFMKIVFPTTLLAIIGYLITFFISFALFLLVGLSGEIAALLSAIIGSTDPAALIPTLKTVFFKKHYKRLVDISVAESALNDAVGAIFTGVIVTMVYSHVSLVSVGEVFVGIVQKQTLLHL
jgi:NhaP-type Na+/H+ or K+/H+ antiporter